MAADHFSTYLSTPFRTFFLLWVPVLFSLIAEPLTGLVDTAFVARLGSEPLAALGVGTVVLTSGMWLFNFLSVGSQTEVSQTYGEGDIKRGRAMGSLALLLGAFIGLLLALLALSWAPQIARLMGAEQLVQEYAATYIRIRGVAAPAVLVTMTSFGILYGCADMRSPLVIALTVNLLNIVLDALLIFGFGPIPPLGIGGAALATTISQWLGCVWALWKVYHAIGISTNVRLRDGKKLLTIGRDMFLRTGSLTLFLILATRAATQLGPDQGAAHQAVRQVWVFSGLFLDASAITAQSIIGYFYGAGRRQEIRLVASHVCIWSVFIGIMLMVLMILGTEAVIVALVPVTSIAMFKPAWLVSALLQPFCGQAFVTDGIHWGTGDFAYLRNGVLLATVTGIVLLVVMEISGTSSLTGIWVVTGVWVIIRALWGTARIWPGSARSPFHKGLRR